MSRRFAAPCVLGLLVMLGAVLPAAACINTFKSEIKSLQAVGDAAAVEQVVKRLEQAHASKPTLESGNDLGVARLLTGKIDAAIKLLRETEKKFPGNARVAANLGTALELKGENEEALKWIREGAIRDPNEHEKSEWLHARILEAKIALAKDPAWFEKNRVLTLDFGSGDVPVAPEILPIEKGRLKGAEELLRQIEYQILERKNFVKAPDAIVGDLYASAGDLAIASGLSRLDGGDEFANQYYEHALEYGAPDADRVRARLVRYLADLEKMPPKPKAQDDVIDYPVDTKAGGSTITFWISVATAIALGIAGVIGFRIRRARKATQG